MNYPHAIYNLQKFIVMLFDIFHVLLLSINNTRDWKLHKQIIVRKIQLLALTIVTLSIRLNCEIHVCIGNKISCVVCIS